MEPAVKTTWNDSMPGIEAATRSGMLEILAKITSQAKVLCPIDTGMLTNSVMWQMEGEEGGFNEGGKTTADGSLKLKEPRSKLVGYVGTNVHYGIYQEAGTRYTTPHPFLRPAVAIYAQGKNAADVMRKWAAIRKKGPLKFGEDREGF